LGALAALRDGGEVRVQTPPAVVKAKKRTPARRRKTGT